MVQSGHFDAVFHIISDKFFKKDNLLTIPRYWTATISIFGAMRIYQLICLPFLAADLLPSPVLHLPRWPSHVSPAEMQVIKGRPVRQVAMPVKFPFEFASPSPRPVFDIAALMVGFFSLSHSHIYSPFLLCSVLSICSTDSEA
jgi:hypothetical protein